MTSLDADFYRVVRYGPFKLFWKTYSRAQRPELFADRR